MSASATLLALENASLIRGGVATLSDLSLSLKGGEVLAMLGANGAGKSTLLSALAGELTLTSGRVLLNGAAIEQQTAAALAEVRALNAVEPPLAFSLSVFEYVALGRPFAAADSEAVDVALRECHAAQWANRDAATLSSGELLRVQLARSLYQLGNRTDCLWLLDEPMAHLDLSQRQFVLRCIRQVATQRRWAVVFSTHEPRDAQQIADHVLMLKAGRTIAYGPTTSTLTDALIDSAFDLSAE